MTEYSDTLSYLYLQAIEIRILFPYLYAHGECATVTLTALYSLHTYNTSIPSHLILSHPLDHWSNPQRGGYEHGPYRVRTDRSWYVMVLIVSFIYVYKIP